MNPKELKKLVKMCREMGVKSYKGVDFEFTLTDSEPVKASAKRAPIVQDDNIESDELDPNSLLFWSAPMGDVITKTEE